MREIYCTYIFHTYPNSYKYKSRSCQLYYVPGSISPTIRNLHRRIRDAKKPVSFPNNFLESQTGKFRHVKSCFKPFGRIIWYLHATRMDLLSSSEPPGNRGFSARQTNSLPSSSGLATNVKILIVEFCVSVT